GLNAPGGVPIGEDIRPSKGINRLLRIANQEQQRSWSGRLVWFVFGRKQFTEDLVLHRISVFELIDERGAVTLAHFREQIVATRAAQRLTQPQEQIIERLLLAPALTDGQFLGLSFQEIDAQSGQ